MKRTAAGWLSAALLAAFLLLPASARAEESEPPPESADPPPEYTVTVDPAIRNGSVRADPDHGPAGAEITLTAIPEDGCELVSLTVRDPDRQEVRVTDGKFFMPAGDVTVTAEFREKAPPPPPDDPPDDPPEEKIYTVAVTVEGSGAAWAEPDAGPEGTEIVLTAEPEEGNAFQGWTVLSGGVTLNGDRFVLGAENAEILAAFAPDGEPEPEPSPSQDPSPTPTPTPSPTPTPTPRPTARPTVRPVGRTGGYSYAAPRATATPTPSPSPVPTPKPTPRPTPSPTPKPTECPWSLTAEAGERGLTFTLTGDDASLAHYTGIRVDGKRVNAAAYDVDFNAGTVTLKRAYLSSLDAGRHTLSLGLGKGAMETGFTPELPELPAPAEADPGTGRPSPWWWLLALLPAAGGYGIFRAKKKKTGDTDPPA